MESLPVRRRPLPSLPCPTAGAAGEEGDLPGCPSGGGGDLCCSFISGPLSQMSVFDAHIPHRSWSVSTALRSMRVEVVE